ncbi:alpha/beta fold hydrolase [Streptomyces sp. NPDC006638]|uniref:thioesterase II family protein n=1 Tax=Streptomyces sp. NPDC006638 TaxID=3157183 RepID=UPI0033B9C5E4
MSTVTGRWTAEVRGAPDAGVRLFCCAHAGGGPAGFRSWQREFGQDVDIRPVLLPGRESRSREQPLRRMADIVGPLCDGLLPLLDRPYALFGHSLGAALAYEVARELAARGWGEPRHLFVSARRAPHLPSRRARLHDLPHDRFTAAVARMGGTPPEVLSHPELLNAFTPCLRADFEVNETYTPLPGGLLGCDVSAVVGRLDPEVGADEMAAWRDTTRGGFGLRVVDGDHFYLKETPGDLFALFRDGLDLSARTRTPVPHPPTH